MAIKKSLSLITILSLILLSAPFNMAEGSNYSFTQTSWAGGQTSDTITHGFSANRDEYSAKDASLNKIMLKFKKLMP